MKIAVVILNWNGKKLLERFLPSVINYSKEANIYIADNASTDESLIYIKTHFPKIKIIKNASNGGYAKGYNDALKILTEDIFVLLNNDVAVTSGWLNPFIKAFKNNPKLVAAQPKLLDFKNKDYFEYAGAAGGFLDQYGYPFCRGRIFDTIEKDLGQYDGIKNIFWASGACFFVRKNAFWEVDGFDEDLFAHQEEIDLCWRMHLQGGNIKYIGPSKVYHLGGGTLQDTNPKKTYYNFRNSLLIQLKNNSSLKVWFIILIRLFLDGIAGVSFLLKGKPKHCLAIIKAHFSFYYLFPKFLQKRKNNTKYIKYYYCKSIVWKYYIKKRRIFTML